MHHTQGVQLKVVVALQREIHDNVHVIPVRTDEVPCVVWHVCPLTAMDVQEFVQGWVLNDFSCF